MTGTEGASTPGRINRPGALGAIANVATLQGDVTTVWIDDQPAGFATQFAERAGMCPAKLLSSIRDGGPWGSPYVLGKDYVIVSGVALAQLNRFVATAEKVTGRKLVDTSTSAIVMLREPGIHCALAMAGTPRSLGMRHTFPNDVVPEWRALGEIREAVQPGLSTSQYVDLMVRGFELLEGAGYPLTDEDQSVLAQCLRDMKQQAKAVGKPPSDGFEATDIAKRLGHELPPYLARELGVALSAGLRLLGYLPEKVERQLNGKRIHVNRWPGAAWEAAVPIVEDFCTLQRREPMGPFMGFGRPGLN